MRDQPSISLVIGLVALILISTAWAQPDEGDMIAKLISARQLDVRKGLSQLSASTEQAERTEALYNGFTFDSGSSKVMGRYIKGLNGTVAVFRTTSGNVYTYDVKDEPVTVPGSTRQLEAGIGASSSLASTLRSTQYTQPPCAWQAYVTGRRFNAAFPDLSAVYQVLVQVSVGQLDILRISGVFPKARYFSYQSYNIKAGMPVSSLADFEIKPDAGSVNPFTDASAGQGGVGTYTIHVTLRKDARFANSLALCPDGATAKQCSSATALIIVRIYASDPNDPNHDCFADPPDNTRIPRLWGYVGAPTVSLTNTKKVNKKTGQWNWRRVFNCDPTQPTLVSSVLNDYIGTMVPDFPAPAYGNKKDNFYMYLGKETVDAGTFANMDATYMSAIGHQASLPLTLRNERLVAKITGVLPKHAMDWTTEPKINKKDDYDVRYVSYSSVAFTSGGPTIDTVSDVEMGAFYKNSAAFKENRTFSIVMAQDKDRTCGLYNATQDLFLSTTYNNTAQDYFGALYRQVVSKHQRDPTKPDKSIGYARVLCTAGGTRGRCDSPNVLRGAMGEFYPSIEWYTCSGLMGKGTLTPITNSLQEFLDSRQK